MNVQLVLVAEPRARHDNPDTSKAAARRVAAAGGAIEHAIADTVRAARRPLTAEAIAESVFAEYDGRWAYGSIVTAVTRASKLNLITLAGEGKTSRGMRARLYDWPGRGLPQVALPNVPETYTPNPKESR